MTLSEFREVLTKIFINPGWDLDFEPVVVVCVDEMPYLTVTGVELETDSSGGAVIRIDCHE
jgi:hypothetical protein